MPNFDETNLDGENRKIERPEHRLSRCCYNCFYFRRRKKSPKRFGLCSLIAYKEAKIRILPPSQKRQHFDITPLDATCDWHRFKGGYEEGARRMCDIAPDEYD